MKTQASAHDDLLYRAEGTARRLRYIQAAMTLAAFACLVYLGGLPAAVVSVSYIAALRVVDGARIRVEDAIFQYKTYLSRQNR